MRSATRSFAAPRAPLAADVDAHEELARLQQKQLDAQARIRTLAAERTQLRNVEIDLHQGMRCVLERACLAFTLLL